MNKADGLEIADAHTFRASVLSAKYGITIEEARAVKDTGVLPVKPEKKKPKAEAGEVSEDGD